MCCDNLTFKTVQLSWIINELLIMELKFTPLVNGYDTTNEVLVTIVIWELIII